MSMSMNETPRRAVVSVPATSANLGPGFDCLGLALELRNEVTFNSDGLLTPIRGNLDTVYQFEATGIEPEKIPLGKGNLLMESAETLFRHIGRRPANLSIHVDNRIPVGSGLGSSSSAIVAGLVGANLLADGGLSPHDLLRIAVDMEGHPDNVAPAMLGGLVLGILPDAQDGPADLIVCRLEPPRLSAVVVMPDFVLLTSEARAILPSTISRSDAIFSASRIGLLLHAMATGDYSCLRVAMSDRLHQPHRLSLIPGAAAALDAAYEAGALGVALSGAGPSLLAFADNGQEAIARAMADTFAAAGLDSRTWLLNVAGDGVRQSVNAVTATDPQTMRTNSRQ